MSKRVNLRERLERGDSVVGPFVTLPSEDVVEIVALAGFDFAVIDTEHGIYSERTAMALVRAAASRNLATVVRVPQIDQAQITKALDMGADAVMVPQIGDLDSAKRAIAAARYFPQGSRGVMAHVRNAEYSSLGRPDFYDQENRRAGVILQIEGQAGITALPDLVKLPGVDCFFIGVMDLSQSLGFPGQPDHPDVIAKVEETVACCREAGKALGIYAHSTGPARRWLSMGIQFIGFHTDAGVIVDAFRGLRSQLP